MKKIIILVALFFLVPLFLGGICIWWVVMQGQIEDAYRAGYEQCAQDTSLYLQLHRTYGNDFCAGIPWGLRHYLQQKKPSPQDKEDMVVLIRDYESTDSPPGWHEYWLR